MDAIPALIGLSEISPIYIPIVGLAMGALIAIVAMMLEAKEKERKHRERMFFAERGMEIPEHLFEQGKKKQSRRGECRGLRTWLVILGYLGIMIGIASIITVSVQESLADGIGGSFGILIGAGLLASERVIARMCTTGNGEAAQA